MKRIIFIEAGVKRQ